LLSLARLCGNLIERGTQMRAYAELTCKTTGRVWVQGFNPLSEFFAAGTAFKTLQIKELISTRWNAVYNTELTLTAFWHAQHARARRQHYTKI
jgi:hypothetical protein